MQIIENIPVWNKSQYKSKYFRTALTDTDYVLCLVSAAEYLGLCNWTTEPQIYVRTKYECEHYHIQIASNNGLYYTTVNQTINDLLSNQSLDEQILLEALADQYYKNQYADLKILPENQKRFQELRYWAERYYTDE